MRLISLPCRGWITCPSPARDSEILEELLCKLACLCWLQCNCWRSWGLLFVVQKQQSLGFGIWFSHNLPPQHTLAQVLRNRGSISDSLAFQLSVFMTASPALERVDDNGNSCETWHEQTSDSARSSTQKNRNQACDTVSFPLAEIVWLWVLSYPTWLHHPLLWLWKKQNCSSGSQEEPVILNCTICRGNDLFGWSA